MQIRQVNLDVTELELEQIKRYLKWFEKNDNIRSDIYDLRYYEDGKTLNVTISANIDVDWEYIIESQFEYYEDGDFNLGDYIKNGKKLGISKQI